MWKIGYAKARDLLHKFTFCFANYNYYLKSPGVICDMSIYN